MTRDEATSLEVGTWVLRKAPYKTGKGYFITSKDPHKIIEIRKDPGIVAFVAFPPLHEKYCIDWTVWDIVSPPMKELGKEIEEAFL